MNAETFRDHVERRSGDECWPRANFAISGDQAREWRDSLSALIAQGETLEC